MIRNWQYHNLYMDFSSMFEGTDHPSDIDMFYLCKDGTLILGEIKNESGTFSGRQKALLAKVMKLHSGDAVGLYITHNRRVQDGDNMVDVSACYVKEIFLKTEGRWRRPLRPVTVKEILEYYRDRSKKIF